METREFQLSAHVCTDYFKITLQGPQQSPKKLTYKLKNAHEFVV